MNNKEIIEIVEKNEEKFWRMFELLLHFANAYSKMIQGVTESVSKGYHNATLFELIIFLEVRMDLYTFKTSQIPVVRESLSSFLNNIISNYFSKKLDNDDLIDIVNHRIQGYASIIRESNQSFDEVHSSLLENIKRSKNSNKVEKWDFKKGSLIIMDVFEETILKELLVKANQTIIFAMGKCLEKLFSDNDNFITLELDEINQRIDDGLKEAQITLEKSEIYDTIDKFEKAIDMHERQLFGIRLYQRCIRMLYKKDEHITDMTSHHYANIIERGRKMLSEAREFLKKAKNKEIDVSELKEFEFLPVHGPGLDEMTIRAKLLVEAYEKLFPGRPRDKELTKEELQIVLNEAVQHFE